MVKNLNYNMAYFIVSYNKPDYIPTLNILKEFGVTNTIYVVVGKDDPQLAGYVMHPDYVTLVFDKSNYVDRVDNIGTYNDTHKVCTYARVFIDDYAMDNGINYVCFMFDDIESIRLRYIGNDCKIHNKKNFNFESIIYSYIDILNSSDSVYLVGPPSSSYYIGISTEKVLNTLSTHYGSMFVYDIRKPIGPYSANVLEDMTIVLRNNCIGHMCLSPFSLQVNCRDAMATDDCYNGIYRDEYVMHHVLMTNGTPMRYDKLSIPYNRFTPKIISDKYRRQ